MKELTLIIGGTQGEGIVSTGAILAKALSRNGYFTYIHRVFASRIKGGHTHSKIEITPFRNAASKEAVHLVVAFDEKTAKEPWLFSPEASLVLTDEGILSPEDLSRGGGRTQAIPFSKTAEAAGKKIMKNSVVLGLLCHLLNIEREVLQEVLSEKYRSKGSRVLEENLRAFEEGLSLGKRFFGKGYEAFHLHPVPTVKRPVMTGNYALALGALAGGCRFVSAYPITPASEIMEYLSKKLPGLGGLMVQTEDEIAAVTMAIGASYGGVRSMTSTSGPGLSLMQEGIGLAAMAELPLVLIDCQRVGPSTGLPTKMEQSDFDMAVYGGHGEFPSIVLAPYSVESCFTLAQEAFDLAEAYTCPVFIMSDLALSLFPQTACLPDLDKQPSVVAFSDSAASMKGDYYPRYAFENSPRPLPGTEGGIHYVTGLEHGSLGTPDHSPENRIRMMKRRMEKYEALSRAPGISLDKEKGRLLVLATGSVHGLAENALCGMEGKAVLGALYRVKPFPSEQLSALAEDFEQILVVEYNYSGQLFRLVKSHLPENLRHKVLSLRKFSGEAFTKAEIANKAKELI